jgi:hypothetical protein
MSPTLSQYKSLGVLSDLSLILNILILLVMDMKAALLVALLKVSLSLGLSTF